MLLPTRHLDSDKMTSRALLHFDHGILWGYLRLYLAKRSSFCYCSDRPVLSESLMQNLKPTHFSAVADHPSAVSDVLDRVVTIAPSPLLPGEKQADYAEIALR